MRADHIYQARELGSGPGVPLTFEPVIAIAMAIATANGRGYPGVAKL